MPGHPSRVNDSAANNDDNDDSGDNNNVWARRFMTAAIVQGAILVVLTAFLVLSQISILKPEVSRVIAAGEAGTWFTFGYLIYIVVGVVGVAVSSIFYHYVVGGYFFSTKVASALAWTHLVLMNVGIAAAAGMMMYAGYQGGAAMLPESIGGKGFNAQQAHSIISPFVEPIGASILVTLTGVLVGGAGFLIAFRKKEHLFTGKKTRRSNNNHNKNKSSRHDTTEAA